MATDPRFEPKLTDEERTQICQWIAQFKKPTEITHLVKSEFGKTVSRLLVYKYQRAPKWKPLIERLREQWALGVMDIPIAHQRERLDRLTQLWEKAETLSPKDQHQQQLAVLREAREEMTASKTTINTVLFASISQTPDAELWARREQLVQQLTQLGGTHGLRRHSERETPELVHHENAG